MSRLFRLRKNEKGQSIVEFALILPILLFLIMGIVQFGLILSGYVTVSNAAREGARVGIIEKDNAAIIAKVNEAFDSSSTLYLASTTPVDITFPEGGTYTHGKPVSVRVNANVAIIVPFLEEILPEGNINIHRTAVMMVEGYIED